MNNKILGQTATTPLAGRVLVVDDHLQARESMADVLRQSGHTVDCCSSAIEALQILQRQSYDCIVTDLKMPGMNGVEFIIEIQQRRYGAQTVMVTAHASVSSAVEAMRHGAFDYIEKPFDADQLEQLVDQAIRHGRLLHNGSGDGRGDDGEPPVMIGRSPQIEALRVKILQVAPTLETILITGESGTGKELVARAVHAASNRAAGPMISVNCPALSAHLMESELFGHEKGAFTGADTPRAGRFELAAGGSLLLDEVTEIDQALQAKLLRVLQEKTFERVGSSQTMRANVRVLATTNRDLLCEVKAGRFRHDLYYRLAVVPLWVLPLRERCGDVPALVDYFLNRCAARLDRDVCRLQPDALDLLVHHHWPGNVRELENIVTRASVLYGGNPVRADELRRWLIGGEESGSAAAQPEVPVGISLEEMERKLIEATLEHFDGHRARTAQALGIGLRTLSGKLRQYGYAPREKPLLKTAHTVNG